MKRLVCIGDSITEGYCIQSNQRWTDQLTTLMDIEVINSGISGDTTGGMLARFHEMVIIHNPDYVIIMGGTNDIRLDLPINLILSNLIAMTRYAKRHSIGVIVGIPPPIFIPKANQKINRFITNEEIVSRMLNYQKFLLQFSVEDDLNFIDFSLNMNQELFLDDGLHPSEAGHKIMAKNAYDRMNTIAS